MERIQKIIANSGYCSRRAAEDIIAKGQVTVNGRAAIVGEKIDPEKEEIAINGKPISKKEKNYYYKLNKPKGILVTKEDPQGRKTIYSLSSLKKLKEKIGLDLNYVGRLDALSEGLLILTNDGDLTNFLTHPKHHVKKTYEVRIEPELKENDLKRLEKGFMIDSRVFESSIKQKNNGDWNTITIQIGEGRNRIIRRVLENKLGYRIFMLKRIKIGNIGLDGVQEGNLSEIHLRDIEKLKG